MLEGAGLSCGRSWVPVWGWGPWSWHPAEPPGQVGGSTGRVLASSRLVLAAPGSCQLINC